MRQELESSSLGSDLVGEQHQDDQPSAIDAHILSPAATFEYADTLVLPDPIDEDDRRINEAEKELFQGTIAHRNLFLTRKPVEVNGQSILFSLQDAKIFDLLRTGATKDDILDLVLYLLPTNRAEKVLAEALTRIGDQINPTGMTIYTEFDTTNGYSFQIRKRRNTTEVKVQKKSAAIEIPTVAEKLGVGLGYNRDPDDPSKSIITLYRQFRAVSIALESQPALILVAFLQSTRIPPNAETIATKAKYTDRDKFEADIEILNDKISSRYGFYLTLKDGDIIPKKHQYPTNTVRDVKAGAKDVSYSSVGTAIKKGNEKDPRYYEADPRIPVRLENSLYPTAMKAIKVLFGTSVSHPITLVDWHSGIQKAIGRSSPMTQEALENLIHFLNKNLSEEGLRIHVGRKESDGDEQYASQRKIYLVDLYPHLRPNSK